MCTKSEYSRYFRTGVENPSEEWHFSGISYALPPQALTGNPWGTFENNVEEGAQLDFTSQCWRVSSTDILQHCLSSITQEELSCLSLQPGTKPGVVKHNCCSALRIPQTSAIPATLWMLVSPTLTLSCAPGSALTLGCHTNMPRNISVLLCPSTPISADCNFWKVEQPQYTRA